MYLSELQNKDIVSIKDGKKIGNIVDININKEGNISALIIGKNKISFNLFKNNSDEEIKWKKKKKIGEDVILVDTNI